jgi:hypothetical protein
MADKKLNFQIGPNHKISKDSFILILMLTLNHKIDIMVLKVTLTNLSRILTTEVRITGSVGKAVFSRTRCYESLWYRYF